MTAKGSLDKLIDWYEENKPSAGRVIRVTMSISSLQRIATLADKEKGLWNYRGRQLERVEPPIKDRL